MPKMGESTEEDSEPESVLAALRAGMVLAGYSGEIMEGFWRNRKLTVQSVGVAGRRATVVAQLLADGGKI